MGVERWGLQIHGSAASVMCVNAECVCVNGEVKIAVHMLRLGNGPGALYRTNEQFIISSCPPAPDPGDYNTTGLILSRKAAMHGWRWEGQGRDRGRTLKAVVVSSNPRMEGGGSLGGCERCG